MDNIVVAQEILHTLRHKGGAKGGMIVKIDLEKAYDRISWKFLKEILQVVGFSSALTQLIMFCAQDTRLAVMWNGQRLPEFAPGRGLRQGDPLSPYLFVLCMETLSHRITKAVKAKNWQAVKVSKKGPTISHLFFADDLLLFGEATMKQAQIMEQILTEFCSESGEKINLRKSKLWFSKNTTLARSISSNFGIPITKDLGSYLGVPLIHGRILRKQYAYLETNVRSKLSGWKMKMLSRSARLLLIQTSTNSIPMYAMQSCKLPVGTVERIERLNRNFLWGSSENKKCFHSVAWKKVCRPKGIGGLGLKNLQTMNEAFLTKLAWRALGSPNNLLAQVFKQKYDGWRGLLGLTRRSSTSPLWRALLKIVPLLKQGLEWEVRNGRTVRFWQDRWLLNQPLSEVARQEIPEDQKNQPVWDYWTAESGWEIGQLIEFLPGQILELLQLLSLSLDEAEFDKPRWRLSSKGHFSTKSCFHLLDGNETQEDPNWRKIWSFVGPSRQSFHLWIIKHDRLLTQERLWKMGLVEEARCRQCGASCENTIHALRDCPKVKTIWQHLLPPETPQTFWTSNSAPSWIDLNLKAGFAKDMKFHHWKYVFRQALYRIWLTRNSCLYGENPRYLDPR